MKIYQLACGDELHFYKKSLVLCFQGTRKVLSTGMNQGGCRSDLEAVFNNDGNPGPGMEFVMRADTYEEHLNIIAEEDLGLDPEKCSGMCTAASMENVSIQAMEGDFFTVTAIVTGGIQANGGRIGDPACYSESGGDEANDTHEKLGTINIMLHIDANLPDGTLVKALASCVEAKVAAIQELLAPSRYSNGLATGSGTDSVILICNPESRVYLTDAGHHSQLGEFIGKTVKKAVKEALYRQSGLGPEFQHDILRRMDRFGVTQDTLWRVYCEVNSKPDGEAGSKADNKAGSKVDNKADNKAGSEAAGKSTDNKKMMPRFVFEDRLDALEREDMLVVYTSLFAHLLDQMEWGLLKPEEAWKAGKQILVLAGLEKDEQVLEWNKSESGKRKPEKTSEKITVPWMVERYMKGVIERLEITSTHPSAQ